MADSASVYGIPGGTSPAAAGTGSATTGGGASTSGYASPGGYGDSAGAYGSSGGGYGRGAEGFTAPGQAAGTSAEPITEAPIQPPSKIPAASYVPAPVAFVSDDDDEYSASAATGYGEDAGDGQHGGQEPSSFRRQDPARPASEKTFDVPTSKRRPVVFEEDDDLDVPDFLK